MVEGHVEWGRKRRSKDYPWLFHVKPKGGVLVDAFAIDSPGARKLAAKIAEDTPKRIAVKYKIIDEKRRPIKIKVL